MTRKAARLLCFAAAQLLAMAGASPAKRMVVIKVDGLPAGVIERLASMTDARTGRSRLPWISEVFLNNGTRVNNFYVRGISLSAPSWQMLETGQHQLIHGNMEYDRFTLRSYDYLNFFPYYTRFATRQVDMPGTTVLDEAGMRLLLDRFPKDERFQGVELYQREHHWSSLQHTLPNRFSSRSPQQLFDEWQTGLELTASVGEQMEREMLEALRGGRVVYLSFFDGDFDHIAHLTNQLRFQDAQVEKLDAFVGRVWTVIEQSPLAAETVMVLVSDHGMDSSPEVLSQGYSLIEWFGSEAGGGQASVTNRHPMNEYKVRGLFPLREVNITAAPAATYLKGQEQDYPTVVLDPDGNERAAVQFRENALNELQLLYQELSGNRLTPARRESLEAKFLRIVDEHRAQWGRTVRELREELGALERTAAKEAVWLSAQDKKKKEEKAKGENLETQRHAVALQAWRDEAALYGDYARGMEKLLKATRAQIHLARGPVTDWIPRRTLGERNTLADLQNYVVGAAGEDFRTVNYLRGLKAIRVRNNVQAGIGSAPVDFVATPLSVEGLEAGVTQAILLYGGDEAEVLVETRQVAGGLEIRYRAVRDVGGTPDGCFRYEDAPMRAGLPLAYWEDAKLHADREKWFGDWHSDEEWLRAVHETEYSNGIVGITEQFVQSPGLGTIYEIAAAEDRPLLERLEQRRRRNVVPDFLVFSTDHWNFNTRTFNPGGNHGSFRRISTHAVLMFAGGSVGKGVSVEEPYDSLNFAPTVLHLVGKDAGAEMAGRVIRELE